MDVLLIRNPITGHWNSGRIAISRAKSVFFALVARSSIDPQTDKL